MPQRCTGRRVTSIAPDESAPSGPASQMAHSGCRGRGSGIHRYWNDNSDLCDKGTDSRRFRIHTVWRRPFSLTLAVAGAVVMKTAELTGRRLGLLITLLFFLGVLVGSAITGIVVVSRVREISGGGVDGRVNALVRYLDRQLDLDERQETALRPIVKTMLLRLQDQRQEYVEQIMPEVRVHMLEFYDILTPGQEQELRERLRPLREQMGIEPIQ